MLLKARRLMTFFAIFAFVFTLGVTPGCNDDGETVADTDDADAAVADADAGVEVADGAVDAEEEVTADVVDEEVTSKPKVCLAFEGRGSGWGDMAAAGLDRVAAELGVETEEYGYGQLALASEDGCSLVFALGFGFEGEIGAAAPAHPDVSYGYIDGFLPDLGPDSNVLAIGFAAHEGSFLVGAAAALKSEAASVGFLGGVNIEMIWNFQAGYDFGAAHIDADIAINDQYMCEPPDFSCFGNPGLARTMALEMYGAGVDVIFHAAGASGAGLFAAAKEHSESSGTQVWAIGVDADEYLTAGEEFQPYILTSMLKRIDNAIYQTTKAFLDGEFKGGYLYMGLAEDGVGYATSGGHLDEFVDQFEALKQAIIDGEIVVPAMP